MMNFKTFKYTLIFACSCMVFCPKTNANTETTQQATAQFDQKKWDQLVKDAAVVIPGKNTPAGLTDKQITDMLKTYAWPKYANVGPDDPKNVAYKKLMIDLNTFTKDIWSGKYSTNGTFPKTGPEITTLDSNWKKDELTTKTLDFHNRGWYGFHYPGEEKAVLEIINMFQKLSEDERKKTMAYHDLAGMMRKGQFSYDKYPDFAINGGYVKNLTHKKSQ